VWSRGVVALAEDLEGEGRSVLIEWAVIATPTVAVVLLVDWTIQLGDSDGGCERTDLDPPGPVSAGPVVVAPREGRAAMADALGQLDGAEKGRGEAA
jgi:hypothetical protein